LISLKKLKFDGGYPIVPYRRKGEGIGSFYPPRRGASVKSFKAMSIRVNNSPKAAGPPVRQRIERHIDS
jgi:hypothetical protein